MIGYRPSQRHLLLSIFILSGFAGLIYQSIWSHYIGLFLGHAAYAQALVLALFMGGMAIGAAWIARAGTRWRNLIRGYAAVELVIGVLGLAFHTLFVASVDLTYDTLIPAAGSPLLVAALKWGLAALLILPQTILLGMTFPLMSGGLIRRNPGQEGNLLGGLYFTNSLGAAIGALASAFVLIPSVGLPGTTMTAGLINVLVALLAWALAREPEPEAPQAAARSEVDPAGQGTLLRFVLWGTALSGAASFVYEITWIRMLAMAVGSTMQAFELMLASFIAGIALGGLWIRRRADASADPLRLAGWMQVGMGLAALLSLVFYANAFEWVGWLMGALARSEGGYAIYHLGTAGLAILIMLPAAFFAGTTLPLFTLALLRSGFGERSIGRVYAWNTMGSILGVFLAMHLLIPGLGLKLALCVAAAIDLAIGLVLLAARRERGRPPVRAWTAGAAAALSLLLAVTLVRFDPMQLASGVYRFGQSRLDPSTEVSYYRDGKTASISVVRSDDGVVSIATNGKSDASAGVAEGAAATDDEPTMIMAAALPLAMHANPRHIGVIGFGSGMTTHTLLADPRVERVDTVEIEAAMVEGARAFGPRSHRAYDDPRSRIILDDAKAYFAAQQSKYDLIISEPSNPWVSGVGALDSQEFYRFIPRQLDEGGLFVQWIHLYSMNDALVASVLNALTPEFEDYAAWLSNRSDLIIVASPRGALPAADYARLFDGLMAQDLQRAGIATADQLAYRKIADARLLRALGRQQGSQANSDFFPTLSVLAPRSRFLGEQADSLAFLSVADVPLLELLGVRSPLRAQALEGSFFLAEAAVFRARQMAAFAGGAPEHEFAKLALDLRAQLAQMKALATTCASTPESRRDLLTRLTHLAPKFAPYLPRTEVNDVWKSLGIHECAIQDESLRLALELHQSIGARDATAMRNAGEHWLALRAQGTAPEIAPLDALALLAADAGNAALGDLQRLREVEHRHGAPVSPSPINDHLRSMLYFLDDSP